MKYKTVVHPGVEVPEDSPWAAFKDGYVEFVPTEKSSHRGWMERAKKAKRKSWHRWFVCNVFVREMISRMGLIPYIRYILVEWDFSKWKAERDKLNPPPRKKGGPKIFRRPLDTAPSVPKSDPDNHISQ
jgi:hypothetical protein